MGILIGSTGFVGSHLAAGYNFEYLVHRSDCHTIQGRSTNLLVCAGLPAQKWKANQDPTSDWLNMVQLAQVISTVCADRAVLISTIDVYQPALMVDEMSRPILDGPSAYGSHRAWFEVFFRSHFPNALVLRLPGLFAPDVRKNLIYDLLKCRTDQLTRVNPESTFQFFDVRKIWDVIMQSWSHGISLLNVSSQPVRAQNIATLFGVELHSRTEVVSYDMRSLHATHFGGSAGYLFSSEEILAGISQLRVLSNEKR
jgi:nucleoside-diphosphate-sugar epimerase